MCARTFSKFPRCGLREREVLDVVLGEEVLGPRHRLELEIVVARVFEEAGVLLARHAFEAQRRLYEEFDAVRAHALDKRAPLLDLERESKVRHRDLVAVDLQGPSVGVHTLTHALEGGEEEGEKEEGGMRRRRARGYNNLGSGSRSRPSAPVIERVRLSSCVDPYPNPNHPNHLTTHHNLVSMQTIILPLVRRAPLLAAKHVAVKLLRLREAVHGERIVKRRARSLRNPRELFPVF